MSHLRALANRLFFRSLPLLVLGRLVGVALVERIRTSRRRRTRRLPRLIWGPVPIISLKYWSEAMRRAGYTSTTCVSSHYLINERGDFDVYRDQFQGHTLMSQLLCDYRFFEWTLRRGDVFCRFFDGGFLLNTPLDRFEAPLLRLAGKKLVVSPYGSDIAVDGYLGGAEDLLFEDYPNLLANREGIRRRVLHTTRWADLIVRHHQPGFLPSYDVVLPNHFAIDFERWSSPTRASDADGARGEVVVFHAPNHRHIKGTDHLERAIAELQDEGLKVRLAIVERRPNEEIRVAMQESDIAADQFHLPGYAMFSIEAMATGTPVLNNVSALPEDIRATRVLQECPLVDTNPDRLKEDLRRLIEDPALRRELGDAGREFVSEYHSYDALGREWDAIVQHVWAGAPLPERLLPQARASVGLGR